MTSVSEILTIALSSGRGDLVKTIRLPMSDEDARMVLDTLADQINANSAYYRRRERLEREGRALMSHLIYGTLRQAARLVAIADPRLEPSGEGMPDDVRAVEEDIMEEWRQYLTEEWP